MNRIALIVLGSAVLFSDDASAADKSQETPKELRGVWVFDHGFVDGEPLDPSGEFRGDTAEFIDGKVDHDIDALRWY